MALKDNWIDLEDYVEGVPDSGQMASAEDINKIAHAVIKLEKNSGAGGITKETDPTVPEWAKQPNKPKYNVDEITNAVHKDDVGNVKKLEIGGSTVEAINMLYKTKSDKEDTYTKDEVDNLIESSGGGGGSPEIYIGTEQPTDENILLWINPEANPGTPAAEDGNEVEY